MQPVVLFVSGGEIFVILLAILIFFGSNKIPDFARMMGKGVREFKKATDDIKREFNSNSSGVLNDIKSIQSDLTNTLTNEVANPLQETANTTAQAVDEYIDPYTHDYTYQNQDYNTVTDFGNEYKSEAGSVQESVGESVASAPSEGNKIGEA